MLLKYASGNVQRILRSALAGFGLAGLAMSAHAGDAVLVPAMSSADAEALARSVRFPEGPLESMVRVICDTNVGNSGKLRGTGCAVLAQPLMKYRNAVLWALHNARVEPARQDGEAVTVEMQFSALFIPHPTRRVMIVANDGAHAGRFGLAYVAPQRIFQTVGPCSALTVNPQRSPCRNRGTHVVLDVQVDLFGRVTEFQIHNVDGASTAEMEALVPAMRFIPGRFDGIPTAMRYTEPFWL